MPVEGNDYNSQLTNICDQLTTLVSKQTAHILLLSFFINTRDNLEYEQLRITTTSTIQSILGFTPAISVIAQSPANGNHVSLELTMLLNKTAKTRILYKEYKGIAYTILQTNKTSEIFIGGIKPGNLHDDFVVQADQAFETAQDILLSENFNLADIIRQWNYVEGILCITDKNKEKLQNYQALNDIRSKFYARHDFKNGYPAATGIGMEAGGILLEIYAAKPDTAFEIIPIKNPKQTDAYHYSGNVLIGDAMEKSISKSTPKFERAKYVGFKQNRYVYISGTASIQKEHTVGVGDVRVQTEITLDNIANLVSSDNLKNENIDINSFSINYSFIRVYIKRKKDLNLVREICDTYYGNIPIHYLLADICRDDLLLEIEGIAEISG